MSFPFLKKYPNYDTETKLRKEKDSFVAIHFQHISQFLSERASLFTSKGSLTVEASCAVCFFFFAMLCLLYLFEIMATQAIIKSALYGVGKEMAQEAYVSDLILPSRMEQKMVDQIGKERLERSMIVGGSKGIDCKNSFAYPGTSIMELSAMYSIQIPVPFFQIPVLKKEEVIRIKGWTGDKGTPHSGNSSDLVYVTQYGVVYHKDLTCTHLDLSIRQVERKEVQSLRNENGEKYQACSFCQGKGEATMLYITLQGDCYHESLACKGLSRKIYAIRQSDAYGLGGCSKCCIP